MNIFSFFSGAGFLDLGFELQGHYNIVFVNEFHEAFNRIYRYARQNISIAEPRYHSFILEYTIFCRKLQSNKPRFPRFLRLTFLKFTDNSLYICIPLFFFKNCGRISTVYSMGEVCPFSRKKRK